MTEGAGSLHVRQPHGRAPDGGVAFAARGGHAFASHAQYGLTGEFRTSGIEGRGGSVLDGELHAFRVVAAGDFFHDRESHVDARRDAAAGEDMFPSRTTRAASGSTPNSASLSRHAQ